jgi:hypothetical protein
VSVDQSIILLFSAASAVCIVASVTLTVGSADEKTSPPFGVTIPPGYRDWRLISVAHEAGDLNDLRAILGNDAAINAYREGMLPFPNGAIIARLAWPRRKKTTKSSAAPNHSSQDPP